MSTSSSGTSINNNNESQNKKVIDEYEDPNKLLLDIDNNDYKPPYFQTDNGGMLSEDGSELYIMGVIDFLTQYTSRKVVERTFKSLISDRKGVSVAPASYYSKRFIKFMDENII